MIAGSNSPGGAKPKKKVSIKNFFGQPETADDDARKGLEQPANQSEAVDVDDLPVAERAIMKKSNKSESAAPTTDEHGQQQDLQPRALTSFKNGRLAFSEKRLALERHPEAIAAIYRFHQLVAQLTESKSLPLAAVPAEFLPLVALIVQEKDSVAATLTKFVETQMCPMVVDEDGATSALPVFTPNTLEAAIAEVADLRNYGVLPGAIQQCCGPEVAEAPHSLALFRWEVKDLNALPKDVHSAVTKRRARRAEGQAECTQWFTTVDEETRQQILAGTLKKAIISPRTISAGAGETLPVLVADNTVPVGSKHASKPAQDLLASKRAKSMLRGQKSLVNFFTLEKGNDKEKKHAVEQSAHTPSKKSSYTTLFHPFHLRQCATMYRYQRPASFSEERFDQAIQPAGNHDISSLLREFKQNASKIDADSEARQRAAKQPVAVCDGVELDDAELHLIRLRSMPMKCLHFFDNRRPDYWGTWSRRLKSVGARRPFARDSVALDYEFDSDGEWCIEDDEGEELVSDDEDDDDEDDDEDEEDDTDFIVGDSEIHAEFSGRPSALGDDDDDDDDDDEEEDLDHNGLNSDTEDDYVSEEEIMEDIDPEEEVDARSALPEPYVDEDGESKPTTRSAHRPRISSHGSNQHQKSGREDDKQPQPQPQPRRRKIMPLTPTVVGLIWNDKDRLPADDPRASAMAALTITCIDCSLPLTISTDLQPMLSGKESKGADGSSRKDIEVTDDVLRIVVEVLHASPLGVAKLVDELKSRIPEASKAQLERLIHEHAVKEKRPPSTRLIWCVHEPLLEKFRMQRKHKAPDENPAGYTSNDVVVLIENVSKRQRVQGPEHGEATQPEEK